MDKLQHYETKLNEKLSKVPLLKKIEKTTGAPKTYLFLGVSALVSISLIFDLGGSLVSDIIGWGPPSYLSLRALEKKNSDEYTQWISYWCVFGLVNLLEYFLSVFSYLIPFYFLIKSAALIWLFSPKYRSAEYIHQILLKPCFLQVSTILNDPDSIEVPSMNDAANSLRASAQAAASKVEGSAQAAASKAQDTAQAAASQVEKSATDLKDSVMGSSDSPASNEADASGNKKDS